MATGWGEIWKQWLPLFSWTPKSLQMVTAAIKLKDTCSLEEKLWQTSLLLFSRSVMSDSLQPMDCSMPGFPALHHFLELAQTHVPWIGDVIQPSHPLSSPSPPALCLSQHQDLFQCVSSSPQVAKVLELQLSISPSNEYSGLISFRMDGWTSLQSKGLSRVFSNTTVQTHQFFGAQLSLWSNSHNHTWLLEKP